MNTLTEKELARRKPLPEGLPITYSDGDGYYPIVDMGAIEIGTVLTDGEITVEVVLNPGDLIGLDIKSPCNYCCFVETFCTKHLDRLIAKERTGCAFGQPPRRVFKLIEGEIK